MVNNGLNPLFFMFYHLPVFPRASVNMHADPMRRSSTPSMLRMQLCKYDLIITNPGASLLTTINNMLLVFTAKQQASKPSIKDTQKPEKFSFVSLVTSSIARTSERDVDPGPEV